MYKENAPFRYDFVGSFLRPACLKKARGDYTTGNITIDDLTRIENEEIEQLIRKQKAAGGICCILRWRRCLSGGRME